MSKQLYEEALADVKKLKELAEDNAKRAILEAVTPRIKDLIENQLLGEAKEEEDKLLLDDMPDEDLESGMMSMPSFDSMSAVSSVPDEEGKVVLDLSMLSSPEGEFALSMDEPEVVDSLVPAEKSEVVKAESAIFQIEKKIDLYTNANPVLRETRSYLVGLASIISEVENMYSALKSSKNSSNKQNLVQRLIECHKTLKKLMEQETNMKNRLTLSEEDVTLTLKNLPDDIDLDDLEVELVSGVEGEEGEEPESEEGEELDLGGEEEEETPEAEEEEETEEAPEEGGEEEEGKMETRWLKGDVVVEIDENMLRKEISRMRALREEAVPSADGHGPGDLGDLEDEDLGDPLEMDLSEADKDPEGDYDMDEAEEDGDAEKPHQAHGMDEADLDELMQAYEAEEDGDAEKPHQAHGMDEADLDEVEEDGDAEKEEKPTAKTGMGAQKESLVRKLAAETRLQTEAKKKAGKAKKAAAQKMKEAHQKMKEAQQKAQKKQQKEAQKAKQDAKASAKQAKQMKEAYDYYATQFNESVLRTRKLQSMLAEADARSGSSKNGASSRLAEETETLRDKLAEMNLFNAKLLFTNKLLQNESLTKRQKAEVIERLDEAQNVREAKLVYESLVKALQGGSNGRVVSESASRGVIGSSSRPARPAATTSALNEGFEAERWAKLAGIIK